MVFGSIEKAYFGDASCVYLGTEARRYLKFYCLYIFTLSIVINKKNLTLSNSFAIRPVEVFEDQQTPQLLIWSRKLFFSRKNKNQYLSIIWNIELVSSLNMVINKSLVPYYCWNIDIAFCPFSNDGIKSNYYVGATIIIKRLGYFA